MVRVMDLVFKQCSLCRERHLYYAHTWLQRQPIIISRSHWVTGNFIIPTNTDMPVYTVLGRSKDGNYNGK